jgi:hypothetical protein
VRSLSRLGRDRTKTAGREDAPFVLRVETDGVESDILARAVIDASGTYETPNPLGGSGLAAVGETAAARRIFYGIPDVLAADRERYAGRRVLVAGSGHSAFNVLLDLAALADAVPGTRVIWAVRRPSLANVFGGGDADHLQERGKLGTQVRALVDGGVLTVVHSFTVTRVEVTSTGVAVHSADTVLPEVDEIVATTGFRPDVSMTRELRLALDPVVESPATLAPLIDPNLHSCGTVPPHGAEELRQPEKDFYIVGMKSYGRAPTFLMLTGYEQVRSVVCALTGDDAGARDVRLVLPETGVCSRDAVDSAASACCGTSEPALVGAAPIPLTIGRKPPRSACC